MRPALALAALLAVAGLAAGCGSAGSAQQPGTLPAGESVAASPGGERQEIDLAVIPLGAADVGGAEVVTDAPIQAPPGADASYHRLLEPGTSYGNSTFELLESTVTEFDDADEAEGFLDLIGQSLTPSFYEELLQRSAGLQPRNLTGSTADVTLGDQSVVQLASFEASGKGAFEAMFVFVRVGRLVQALFVVTPAGKLDVADVAELAGTVAARMRDAQPEAA